jgi:hypothetical protein
MLLQDIPSSDHVDQDEGDVWETVGETAERSTSPPPAEASRPQPVVSPAGPQPAVAEERRAPIVV